MSTYDTITHEGQSFDLPMFPNDIDPELESILRDYVAKLETYGTADALALAFAEHGIQATTSSAQSCAVAKHAADVVEIPEGTEIRIGASGAFIMCDRESEEEGTERVILAQVGHGPVVKEFIDRFDHGKYPELMDEYSRSRALSVKNLVWEQQQKINGQVLNYALAQHVTVGTLNAVWKKEGDDTPPAKIMFGMPTLPTTLNTTPTQYTYNGITYAIADTLSVESLVDA